MGMAYTMRLSTILSIHKISKMKKLLFQTPPWRFDWFAPNFACSMCERPWQKVINRIALVHKMAKIWNNNFLHIVAKTDSLAYLYEILSDCHKNVHNCVPLPDERLRKSANWWRSGRSLITVNRSKLENLKSLFKTHWFSTFSCASYVELQSPFQLLKSQKNFNYLACRQLFKIFYGFEIITVLVLRIFRPSSDFIMGVYCVS